MIARDVEFSYEEGRPVLQEINFHVEPGEMIGLVGPSGAGKSTMINLIARLYDVDSGAIMIDGVNIKDIAKEDLNRQIGMVLQDTFLFRGSILENIAYAKPEATMEEIIRAAKIANAHDFIMKLPDGYETVIGRKGHDLSGRGKAAVGHRPGGAVGSPHFDSRRSYGQHRHRNGAADSRGFGAACSGADHLCHRSPLVDSQASQPAVCV